MFLLMIAFPKRKLPAETFVDPEISETLSGAATRAVEFIEEHSATEVVIYKSQNGRILRMLTVTADDMNLVPV